MKEAVKHVAETAAPAASEAAHAAASHEGLLQNPVTWIALSFLIFVALFVKFVLPMINKGLDARADKIRDQLEQATRLRAEAQALLATYQAQQQEMLKEAETIVATAQKDAAAMRDRAAEDLKQAIDRRTQQAQEKIARAEVDAINQIRARIIDTATESARTMIAQQMQGAQEEQAIANALAAIEQQIH